MSTATQASTLQFAAGIASYVSGQIMGQTATGEITHFPTIGVLSLICAFTCVYLAKFLRIPAGTPLVSEPIAIEQ